METFGNKSIALRLLMKTHQCCLLWTTGLISDHKVNEKCAENFKELTLKKHGSVDFDSILLKNAVCSHKHSFVCLGISPFQMLRNMYT